MKLHPDNGKLAVNGCELLQTIAHLDDKYLDGIKKYDAVPIISSCMQANPDLVALVDAGRDALKLLAGQDDLTKAMDVLLNFDKYDNKMISQVIFTSSLAMFTRPSHISTRRLWGCLVI